MSEIKAGPADAVSTGTVIAAEGYAVGNNGDLFAVTRKCRHLGGNLAEGSIDDDGCLVCPWHAAKYDVTTGQMVLGPQGIFAKIPGLGLLFKSLTRVLPLGRKKVEDRDGTLWLS
ncbi:MAG: nitrite reductase/ring-hydroxylating ferredoxin subunit [Glaciecola sp.]|jgi:nitrite reductase/ring-hydroxylating ferredoxin subunit